MKKAHFYKDLPGWFDFEDVYLEAVLRAPPRSILVELGVYEGASLAFLAVEAWNSKKDLMVVGVDTFEHSKTSEPADAHYMRVRDLFFDQGLPTLLLWGHTQEMVAKFAPKSLEFVFVDADHSEDAVFEDIAAYWERVRSGGWLAGHDIDDGPGVGKAVRRFWGPNWSPCSARCWRGERV